MNEIIGVHAREILDSRGNPTVEAEVWLESGTVGKAAVPSGASTGAFEALELRDGEDRYLGKGVLKAVEAVNTRIGPELVGVSAEDQTEIDEMLCELDGTDTKENLGANAMLSVSMACARAAALDLGIPLWTWLGGSGRKIMPTPMMNVINGGVHADNNLDIQEFMIIPHGADSYPEALRMGVETYHTLKGILKKRGYAVSIGDEGGFAPNLQSNSQAMEILVEAIEAAGYRPGVDISLALDVAASELLKDGVYRFAGEARDLSVDDLVAYYRELCDGFPLVSIEDGMAEEDWTGWEAMTRALGDSIQIVGDDIFVTNPVRLEMGLKRGVANAVLVKLNQIGTVTETLKLIDDARWNGYGFVISHRSGETEDSFIADLAVATGSGQIKTGAPARVDRVAKYNRLLVIEEETGGTARYTGLERFRRTRALGRAGGI